MKRLPWILNLFLVCSAQLIHCPAAGAQESQPETGISVLQAGKEAQVTHTSLAKLKLKNARVLISGSPDHTAVAVLSGDCTIVNRTDRSTIKIQPGVIVEISRVARRPNLKQAEVQPAPLVSELINKEGQPTALFQTKDHVTVAYRFDLANAKKYLAEGKTPKCSETAIQNSLKIVSPPSNTNYEVGATVMPALSKLPAGFIAPQGTFEASRPISLIAGETNLP